MSGHGKTVRTLDSETMIHYAARRGGSIRRAHLTDTCPTLAAANTVFSERAGESRRDRPLCRHCTGDVDHQQSTSDNQFLSAELEHNTTPSDIGLSPVGERRGQE